MKYGERIKEHRIAAGLTLREFTRRLAFDASNWSKIERDIAPPPADPGLHDRIAALLALSTLDLEELTDLAALARNELPRDLDDAALLAKMPAFFRAMKERQYTEEDFARLIEDVRKAHSLSEK